MTKILKPYTIIPADLYVQRDADRQVKNIISDMGRPGYVLVSRQMGKTNLLLNAKRNLETENDIFVYVDLSNTFQTAKLCFENIINTAIDSNYDKFHDVSKTILERRTELKDTPPHKQHINELRFLLKALNGGKLVIILDEIDALTKTDYSDQIFSQIRSSYFAERVNYKEFYNLTYLLSGVVEPNEIIKDPKISPFNIGQKIYLNDFSKVEYENFLKISKIDIPTEISDRVFFWTNGNPRITWDLCSEVENLIKASDLSKESVDKTVSSLYLTTYDKPPIDNIRELVKKDREIRNAIVEIEYNKGRVISDKIKSKLYLSGITNYDENNVSIKNEIIKQSLNLDWIKSLEQEEKGNLNLALENYENKRFSDALIFFEKFLETDEFPDSNKDICYYYMGFCIYIQGDLKKALEHFEKTAFDVEDTPKMFFAQLNFRGLIHKRLKDYPKSIECYDFVIANAKNDENYLRATLNLGHLYMNGYVGEKTEEAIKLFEIVTNFENSKKVKGLDLNYYKCAAFYNLADIARSKNELQAAAKLVNQAIPLASENSQPALRLLLADVSEVESEKIQILIDIIKNIDGNRFHNVEPSLDKPLDLNKELVKDILITLYEIDPQSLEISVTENKTLLVDKAYPDLLFELSLASVSKNNLTLGVALLKDIYSRFNAEGSLIDEELKYGTLKLLAYTNNFKQDLELPFEYINLFSEDRKEEVNYIDFEIFSNTIFYLSEHDNFSEALKYIKIIDSKRNRVEAAHLINYLVIRHLEVNLYYYMGEKSVAIEKAKELIHLINKEDSTAQKNNLLGDTGLDVIKQNALAVSRTLQNRIPIKNSKSYSRNETVKVRYKDGTILETKYKKVESDFNAGLCIVLN